MPHLPETMGGTRRRDGVSVTKAIKNSLFGGSLLQGVLVKKIRNKRRITIVKTMTPINDPL